jgi:hypothetical protein
VFKLQAHQLLYAQKQKNHREEIRIEKVLSLVPQAHDPQRNQEVVSL